MTANVNFRVPAIAGFLILGPALLASVWFHRVVRTVRADSTQFAGVLNYHNDNQHTGQNLNETVLTLQNVTFATFGKLFVINVDGPVDAQPLYVPLLTVQGKTHNVLYVATENDSLYAFDADTGAQLWHRILLRSGEIPSDNRGCDQVCPTIGITSTPVIDVSQGPHGAILVVTMSKDGSGNYFQRLHSLDLTTGDGLTRTATEIRAKFPGSGDNSQNGFVVFDPKAYKERAALLLLNHVVYLSWASHCDFRPYTGWIMGYDESTLKQVSVINVTPNGAAGSIWGSGAGPASDSDGNIYFLDANGTFDTALDAQGFPVNGDFGNGMIKLSTTGGKLRVADYFNTFDTVSESNTDTDLGSGGLLVLPPLTDAGGNTRNLVIGAGKDRNVYVADRDNMGKFSPNNNNAIYQELVSALPGAEFAMPAYFNGFIYFGSVGAKIMAFQFSQALLSTAPVSQTSGTFNYPGTTPSVSANGSLQGIVWATENTTPAILYAYDAGNLANELYNSNQAPNGRDNFGTGNKFITPTIANGKVYVGTTNGVGVFGLLAPKR